MKRVILLPVLILLCGVLFSGCSVFFNNEYLSITPHLEQRPESSDDNWLEADNYMELKSTIIHLIQTGADQGIIRCYGTYPGDLSRDLPNAIYEVMKEEPIGAYAVEYIPYETPVHFPAYYEMHISITYSRTKEQIRNIVNINGQNDLKQELLKSMLAYKSSLVAEISYYDESVYDVNRLMSELYYEYPDAALGMPKVAVSFYPDKGFTRIMDIALTYSQSPIVLVSEAKQLNEFARSVSSDVSELSPYDKIVYFYEYLQKNVKPDESGMNLSDVHGDSYKKTESSTAYGALVIKSAMPEGYALALKKLCELSDIECTVVPGRYGDRSHYWNIVKLGSGYYHIDASMGLFEAQQGQAVCLLADSAMPQQYRWDSEKYPKCTANEYIYPSPPPSASPGPGEKAGESPSPSPKGKGG